MKSVLVTGFEPFGGAATNPSQEIARALHGRTIAGRPVVGATLPCVFGDSRQELVRLMRIHEPTLVICLGVAGGRDGITPERVAINIDDARIADNAGKQPVDVPIVRGGAAAYWSRLPVKAIVAALDAKRIKASVSQTAGTFVCNHIFYCLMHTIRWQKNVRGGFIHVPFDASPENTAAGWPTLPLETMIDAIATAVEVSVTTKRDLRLGGGRVS